MEATRLRRRREATMRASPELAVNPPRGRVHVSPDTDELSEAPREDISGAVSGSLGFLNSMRDAPRAPPPGGAVSRSQYVDLRGDAWEPLPEGKPSAALLMTPPRQERASSPSKPLGFATIEVLASHLQAPVRGWQNDDHAQRHARGSVPACVLALDVLPIAMCALSLDAAPASLAPNTPVLCRSAMPLLRCAVHLADPAWYFTEPYRGSETESGLAAAFRATLDFANGYGPAQLTSANSMPIVDPYVSPSPRPGQPSHLVVCSPLNFRSISLPGSQKYWKGCAPDYERYARLARSRRST